MQSRQLLSIVERPLWKRPDIDFFVIHRQPSHQPTRPPACLPSGKVTKKIKVFTWKLGVTYYNWSPNSFKNRGPFVRMTSAAFKLVKSIVAVEHLTDDSLKMLFVKETVQLLSFKTLQK